MPKNQWINRRQAVALGVMLVSVALYNVGRYWENYTLTHSPNPRIDFNFGAAMLMMLALGVGFYGIVQFLLGFRREENIQPQVAGTAKAAPKTKTKKRANHD